MANDIINLDGLVHVWGKVKTLTKDFVKSSDLATVATTGSYNDLKDKPTVSATAISDTYIDNLFK